MIRLDMSEYQDKRAMAKLIGDPLESSSGYFTDNRSVDYPGSDSQAVFEVAKADGVSFGINGDCCGCTGVIFITKLGFSDRACDRGFGIVSVFCLAGPCPLKIFFTAETRRRREE